MAPVRAAGGEMLFGRDECERYLARSALAVLQPDCTQLDGLTAFLKVVPMAERHLLPEVAVHLARGSPAVTMVEYMP